MIRLVGIVLLIAATGAQASHWVPVATGPGGDPTGLYLDSDSLKGTFPVKIVREKFLNSYGEQRLSVVEMNCSHNTWREVTIIVRSPTGSVLKRQKFFGAKSKPIASRSSQELARSIICNASKGQLAKKRRGPHR